MIDTFNQTVQTQIRLLQKEQSDQACTVCHCSCIFLMQYKCNLFRFWDSYDNNFSISQFLQFIIQPFISKTDSMKR